MGSSINKVVLKPTLVAMRSLSSYCEVVFTVYNICTACSQQAVVTTLEQVVITDHLVTRLLTVITDLLQVVPTRL